MKAIVIAEDHYNGLGLIRSLGEEGIYIHLILLGEEPTSMIEKSKYVNAVNRIVPSEQNILQAIDSIITDDKEIYIYPLSDFSAIVCDRNSCRWGKSVIVPNAKGNIEKFENKKFFSDYVRKFGIATPKNRIINKGDSIDGWDCYPVVIKPLLSIEGHKVDITIAETKDELQKSLDVFWDNNYSRVLIEQYIGGKDEHMIEVMGISNGDDVFFARIISKIRERPIKNGSTAFAELVDSHPGVELENIRNLIHSIKYDGIFDVEFKYANGIAYFIELNFRNGAPAYVSTMDGFNLAYNWILLHENKKIKQSSKDIKRFMVENKDIMNMLKGEVRFLPWMKDFCHSTKIFFKTSDFRPSVHYYLDLLQCGSRKLFKHG